MPTAAIAHEAEIDKTIAATMTPLWRDTLFWLTLTFTVFAIAPFVQPGYFWDANDARHHVYFLFEYDRSVQDGIWWPRWSPDFAFGYGYPFFNIYAPCSHFLAELLHHFFNVGFTDAVEAIFGLSIVGSATSMYLFMRSWAGRHAAAISALVYVYIPYHLLNLYIRGNLAESMAFVWLPLCLWAARQCVINAQPSLRGMTGNRTRTQTAGRHLPNVSTIFWMCCLAISYAGLMLTSNLVVVLFTPVLTVYILVLVIVYGAPTGSRTVNQNDWMLPARIKLWVWVRSLISTALWPAFGGILGLGLSAIFWIPAFIERQDVREDQWFDGRFDFHGHFIYFYQLFDPQWGFGNSQLGPNDPISFQIGIVPLVLIPLGLVMLWPLMKPGDVSMFGGVRNNADLPVHKELHSLSYQRWEIACFLLCGVTATGFALTWAAPLWDMPIIGTVLGFAQFPWRWFNVSSLCFSILAGLILHPAIWATQNNEQQAPHPALSLPLLSIIAAILVISYPMLQVRITEPAEGPIGLASLMRFQQSADEMTGSTRWVKEIPRWSPMAEHYTTLAAMGEPVEPVSTKVDYTNATNLKRDGVALGSVAHTVTMEEVYFITKDDTHQITFNHFYYPGWNAYLLDGMHGEPVQELPIIPEEEGTLGRMTVPLPEGEGFVRLQFEDTSPRRIGKQISIGSLSLIGLLLLTVCVMSFFAYKEDKKHQTNIT